jgi:hypothetical protein
VPHESRLDPTGAIHHVALCGANRDALFREDADREAFLARFERLALELASSCFAWALLPNEIQLALASGRDGISKLIARLGTSYALYFNQKYDRVGHVFQSRFRSRLTQGEADLVRVVRAVHLDPFERGVVPFEELPAFRWCGHGALLGVQPARPFHAVRQILALIDRDPIAARAAVGRWTSSQADRIERPKQPVWPRPNDLRDGPAPAFAALVDQVCRLEMLPRDAVLSSVRRSELVRARRTIARIAARELGMSAAEIARRFRMSRSAVARMSSKPAGLAPS